MYLNKRRKKRVLPFGTTLFQFLLRAGWQDENMGLLLSLYMALGAPCWTSRFIGLLCLIMAAFTVLMVSVFCRKGLSLCGGFMTVFAKLARGLALLPGVVALQTIDLQCLRMLLMGEFHFPVGRIIFNHILCKKTADHEAGEHETRNDPNAD
jgi:hypothetical protein